MKTLKAKLKGPRTSKGKKFKIDLGDWSLEQLSLKATTKLNCLIDDIEEEIEKSIDEIVYENVKLIIEQTFFKEDELCLDIEFVIHKKKLFLKVNLLGMEYLIPPEKRLKETLSTLIDPYKFLDLWGRIEDTDEEQSAYLKTVAVELHKLAETIEKRAR